MVTPAVFAEVVRAAFGIEATAVPLGGERDWNARIDVDGVPRYLLKIHRGDPGLQDAVLRHVEHVPVPRVVGAATVTVEGRPRGVRLHDWLDGRVWANAGPHGESSFRALGAAVARLDRALATFEHDGLDRAYRWNMLQAGALLSAVPVLEPDVRPFVERTLVRFRDEVAPVLRGLPAQAIHNDANEHNVLVGPRGEITGILDFGDVVRAPRICGLAVALAYAQLTEVDPVGATLPLVADYHAEWPLTTEELGLLADLVDTRLAMSVANAAEQRHADPANDYLDTSQASVRELIEVLSAEPRELREARYRDACGYRPIGREREIVRWLLSRRCDPAPILRHDPRTSPVLVLDWTAQGPPDLRMTRGPDAVTEAVERRMAASGAVVAVGRYREHREVYRSDAFAPARPGGQRRTVHLGIDLFVPAGEPVFAPLDGVVRGVEHRSDPYDYGGVVLLEHATGEGIPFWVLIGHLSPSTLRAGQPVRRGEQIGTVGSVADNGSWPPHVHVQLFTTLLGRATDLPGVASAGEVDVWQSISPDPNLLLRIPFAPKTGRTGTADEILRHRRVHLSGALSLSYSEPLHIVSGRGAYLVDADGRQYLDLVNNVCHVGHCHPRVVEALREQAGLLNTNTRYLHANLTDYARRLAATFPDPLSVVMLTNSGSEANDLALRLARTATGREQILVLDWAYHGNLTSLIEISPYKFNRHGGPSARVRVCRVPDPYRGADGPQYATDLAGTQAAAFIHESMPGCAGQLDLADGYLPAAYEIARANGALCIADEVQCGFGRVGSHMWAFEHHGVVPDIVTLGKPIGNGHPIGAVVTTPQVAHAFVTGMEYFNTYGGNPVSCAVGLAVLDVMCDERLMAHAATVGEELKRGLAALADRHALIGDVRGRGLFLGVELVEDRTAKTPATAAAKRVIEAAKRQGLLLSTDGPHDNVLKIKPPLVITAADAHQAVNIIDHALRQA